MENSFKLRHGCTVLLAVAALSAGAQNQIVYKCHCHNIGVAPQEPLGDRDGHAISVGSYTCRVEGGPLDGGVLTGMGIYEWDKLSANGLSGNGVGRKAGATVVYQLGDFKSVITLTDGKPSGYEATGRGTYKVATGSAALLAGKSFTYVARPAGSGQFVIDVKVE